MARKFRPRISQERIRQPNRGQMKRERDRNAADARRMNGEAAEEYRTIPGTRLPAYGFSTTGGELLGFRSPRDGDKPGCPECGADLVPDHVCMTDEEVEQYLIDAARRANPMGRDLQGEMRKRTRQERSKRRREGR